METRFLGCIDVGRTEETKEIRLALMGGLTGETFGLVIDMFSFSSLALFGIMLIRFGIEGGKALVILLRGCLS